MNWIEVVGAFVGGSGLTAIFQSVRDSRKDRNDEIFQVLNEYKGIIKELKLTDSESKKLLKEHSDEIRSLKDFIADLRSKVILLESASNDLPFPMWLKDVESKMLYCNLEYEEAFLKPMSKKADDYIGRFDHEVWGMDLGKIYRDSDIKTLLMKTGSSQVSDPIIINGEDVSNKWRVIKYLRYVGKVVIGVGGIAIPYQDRVLSNQ